MNYPDEKVVVREASPKAMLLFLVSKLCLTLCDHVDCQACQDSSVHGISKVSILECVVISFSKGSSWPRDCICVSCIGKQILYWAIRAAKELVTEQQLKSRFSCLSVHCSFQCLLIILLLQDIFCIFFTCARNKDQVWS